jgi:hypothetical protein
VFKVLKRFLKLAEISANKLVIYFSKLVFLKTNYSKIKRLLLLKKGYKIEEKTSKSEKRKNQTVIS